MSRPQPTRPGVRRPTAGPPSQVGTNTKRGNQPTIEEQRTLPQFEEDGPSVDYNPENASIGKIVQERVTIGSARFAVQDWKRRDGTYPENSFPEVQIQLGLRRDGDDENTKLYVEGYRYANVNYFAPSKDGNFCRVRKSVADKAVAEGIRLPVPRKSDSGVALLQSIVDGGGKAAVDRIEKEGIKALVGLTVDVRLQAVKGAKAEAKHALLVDHVHDTAVVAKMQPAKSAAASAPVAATSQAQAVNTADLAEEVLFDLLTKAGGTLIRAQIPATLIRDDKWKTHPQRPVILQTLRDDKFVASSSKWVLDGDSIILA